MLGMRLIWDEFYISGTLSRFRLKIVVEEERFKVTNSSMIVMKSVKVGIFIY